MRLVIRPFVRVFCLVSLVCLVSIGCGSSVGTSPDRSDTPMPDDGPVLSARLGGTGSPGLNVLDEEADGACPAYRQEELREPVTVYPRDGVLSTELVVAMKTRCVPVFDSTLKRWHNEPLTLRTYGHAEDITDPLDDDELDPDSEALVFSAPGPTFMLRKATRPGRNDGTKFKMVLHNLLEPQEDPHACDPLHKGPDAEGDDAQALTTSQVPPNCFHGNNSTNFHFHGFHVSPQPHQDYVGLELLPYGATPPPHATHGRGEVAVGEYRYDLDRLRHTQPEGTHWYHAHKHGSTALQVLNGLVGTFRIRGAFDRELNEFYDRQGGLDEKLLVVQQLQELPPGLGGQPPHSPAPLINGMANPLVRMRSGEVQRWRFVSATMQASAKLEIGFSTAIPDEDQPQIRQVAMDGVQFSPQNYKCQPILYGPDCIDDTEDDSFRKLDGFLLEPGSRMDILIKAPLQPGRYALSFRTAEVLDPANHEEIEELEAGLLELARTLDLPQAPTDPPLLTLEVIAGPPSQARFPRASEFPKMPRYLRDIPEPRVTRTVGYEMINRGNLEGVRFSICGEPYDPDCVNETLTLDVAEEWTLTNNSNIAHPFHIHTNPFQLLQDQDAPYPYPIWRDTVAIPTGTPVNLGKAVIRYHPTEFTGEFVNHCHILGHEDRGMMHNVQVRCPNGEWGRPTADLSEECREGNYVEAAPECTVGVCEASGG